LIIKKSDLVTNFSDQNMILAISDRENMIVNCQLTVIEIKFSY